MGNSCGRYHSQMSNAFGSSLQPLSQSPNTADGERRASFARGGPDEEERAERQRSPASVSRPPSSRRGTVDECAICYRVVPLRTTACKHAFCDGCLESYVRTFADNEAAGSASRPLKCPMCRQALGPSDVPAAVRHLMLAPLARPALASSNYPPPRPFVRPVLPPSTAGSDPSELSPIACMCCCVVSAQLLTHAARWPGLACVILAAALWCLVVGSLVLDWCAERVEGSVPWPNITHDDAEPARLGLGGLVSLVHESMPSGDGRMRLIVALRLGAYAALLLAWCLAACMLDVARRLYGHRDLPTPACCLPCLASAMLHRLGYSPTTYILCQPLAADSPRHERRRAAAGGRRPPHVAGWPPEAELVPPGRYRPGGVAGWQQPLPSDVTIATPAQVV